MEDLARLIDQVLVESTSSHNNNNNECSQQDIDNAVIIKATLDGVCSIRKASFQVENVVESLYKHGRHDVHKLAKFICDSVREYGPQMQTLLEKDEVLAKKVVKACKQEDGHIVVRILLNIPSRFVLIGEMVDRFGVEVVWKQFFESVQDEQEAACVQFADKILQVESAQEILFNRLVNVRRMFVVCIFAQWVATLSGQSRLYERFLAKHIIPNTCEETGMELWTRLTRFQTVFALKCHVNAVKNRKVNFPAPEEYLKIAREMESTFGIMERLKQQRKRKRVHEEDSEKAGLAQMTMRLVQNAIEKTHYKGIAPRDEIKKLAKFQGTFFHRSFVPCLLSNEGWVVVTTGTEDEFLDLPSQEAARKKLIFACKDLMKPEAYGKWLRRERTEEEELQSAWCSCSSKTVINEDVNRFWQFLGKLHIAQIHHTESIGKELKAAKQSGAMKEQDICQPLFDGLRFCSQDVVETFLDQLSLHWVALQDAFLEFLCVGGTMLRHIQSRSSFSMHEMLTLSRIVANWPHKQQRNKLYSCLLDNLLDSHNNNNLESVLDIASKFATRKGSPGFYLRFLYYLGAKNASQRGELEKIGFISEQVAREQGFEPPHLKEFLRYEFSLAPSSSFDWINACMSKWYQNEELLLQTILKWLLIQKRLDGTWLMFLNDKYPFIRIQVFVKTLMSLLSKEKMNEKEASKNLNMILVNAAVIANSLSFQEHEELDAELKSQVVELSECNRFWQRCKIFQYF